MKAHKGNIIDSWYHVSMTAWRLCKDQFPHPSIKQKGSNKLWNPDEFSFNLAIERNNDYVCSVLECRYYDMEDWLSAKCSGYFLLMSKPKHLIYDLYFEKEKDQAFFLLSW